MMGVPRLLCSLFAGALGVAPPAVILPAAPPARPAPSSGVAFQRPGASLTPSVDASGAQFAQSLRGGVQTAPINSEAWSNIETPSSVPSAPERPGSFGRFPFVESLNEHADRRATVIDGWTISVGACLLGVFTAAMLAIRARRAALPKDLQSMEMRTLDFHGSEHSSSLITSEAKFAVAALGGKSGAQATSDPVVLKSTLTPAVATIDEAPAPAPPPFEPSAQLGAMAPLGFFDPMGFTKVGDEAGFRKLRASELKHGRVAMMASIGLVGQCFVKFPWAEKAPSGFAALYSAEGVLGIWALILPTAVLELAWRDDPNREPGNFGDPFGVKMYTDEMRTKEISNGRMAMISVLGIFAAEMATGKDAIQQFGLFAESGCAPSASSNRSSFAGRTSGGSVSRRQVSAAVATIEEAPAPAPPPFEPSAQLGAMAPLGFFDPMEFTKVGDEAGFRKLRASELKHGRVAMMASIGLVGQHFVKFPWAESAPSGFAALYSAEGVLGMWALILPTAVLELAWRDDPNREPGNFGDPFGVKMYTDEMRTKEISNGRMAMISVLGIFAAEMATGKDAIQQFGL